MRPNPHVVHDPWLSQWMGRPSYQLRVEGVEAARELLAEDVFVFAKTSTTDVAAVGALENAGFRVVDTQVVLERDIGSMEAESPGITARAARPEDESAVEKVARESFRFSRFHLDPAVPRAVADEIKAQWAKNFFHGKRGDALVVAEDGGAVCGFNQLLVRDGGKTLVIDLIGVAAGHQGKGAAAAMIGFAARTTPGATRYRVATQVANVPSLRLYEKLGFRMCESQYVLHAHGRRA